MCYLVLFRWSIIINHLLVSANNQALDWYFMVRSFLCFSAGVAAPPGLHWAHVGAWPPPTGDGLRPPPAPVSASGRPVQLSGAAHAQLSTQPLLSCPALCWAALRPAEPPRPPLSRTRTRWGARRQMWETVSRWADFDVPGLPPGLVAGLVWLSDEVTRAVLQRLLTAASNRPIMTHLANSEWAGWLAGDARLSVDGQRCGRVLWITMDYRGTVDAKRDVLVFQ